MTAPSPLEADKDWYGRVRRALNLNPLDRIAELHRPRKWGNTGHVCLRCQEDSWPCLTFEALAVWAEVER